MAGTSSVAPAGHGCREPYPGCTWLRPYRASILSPLAPSGPARSACFLPTKFPRIESSQSHARPDIPDGP